MSEKFLDENLAKLDKDVLRVVIRERAHHTFEIPLYRILRGERQLTPGFGDSIKKLLSLWDKHGVTVKCPDIEYVRRLLKMVDQMRQGKKVKTGTKPIRPLSQKELRVDENLIVSRRSIRAWTNKKVSRGMIRRIVLAGLWAPHACNLQSIKVLVVDDPQGLEVFSKSETRGAPVRLVICQDMRGYEFYSNQIPDYNSYLDAGAAAQNMLLIAQALGLGAVWLTFRPDEIQALRDHYKLPAYIRVTTYLALGWPAESPIPPARKTVDDAVISTASSSIYSSPRITFSAPSGTRAGPAHRPYDKQDH